MQLGIRTRLYAGFGNLTLITAALAGFSTYQQSQLGEQYDLRSRLEGSARNIFSANLQATRLSSQAEVYRLNPKPELISVPPADCETPI